ncbi:hypothetical protein Poli38472_013219 [Pythium oligandrum]|uniref:EF-hand domain-containing protein n=1 Tax=Pythium oligandrum TaxID=41045 RepID=A0A8K1C2T2_PYTOL|nr:hypothetical protein Poli38472_013219 [Pythium oligandrum]|eukprot:TMW55328.1 hypothetical protein Poli38472_013219 [Pythium oligandrum]
MGVDFSKQDVTPLATACVAEITQFNGEQVQAFRKLLHLTRTHDESEPHDDDADIAAETTHPILPWGTPDMDMAVFRHALEEIAFKPSDSSILERIFTLLDPTGDDEIHGLELLIVMITLLKCDLRDKFQLALESTRDELGDTLMSIKHLIFVLLTMTRVANFFGDPLLPPPVIEAIADDVWKQTEHGADIPAIVKGLVVHPLVIEYVKPAVHADRSS